MEKPTISAREAEILTMLSLGLNSFQIADRLFISHHTVRTHRKNILRKLRVSSSLLAIRLYLQNEIIIQDAPMEFNPLQAA
jgi:DNA-binding CsgD family transcriptional regulator